MLNWSKLFSFVISRKLFIALLFVIIAYRIIICFNYTPEISVGETNNIWNAVNVIDGKSLYSDPENTPFEIYQYTPVSQYPLLLSAYLLDSRSNNYTYNIMVFGRLFSLLFNIIAFYLLFLILKNHLRIRPNLATVASILAFGLLTHLSFSIRPDAMSFMMVLLALYLFGKAYFEEKKYHYIFCSIAFSFSFFIKQDSFLILSALGLVLLFLKEFKSVLALSASFILSFLLFYLMFALIHGDFFSYSIFNGLNQESSMARVQLVFERYLHFYALIFFVSLFFLIYSLKTLSNKKTDYYLISLYVVSFIIALGTSAKEGSWINYFTVFNTLAIVLLFYSINQLNKGKNQSAIEFSVTMICSLVLMVFLLQQIFHYTSPFLKYSESKEYHHKLTHNFNAFKQDAIKGDYKIFVYDKSLKLILYKNTLFPNTEYYGVSSFSKDNYQKLKSTEKLTHIIGTISENHEQFKTLDHFNILFDDFTNEKQILNFTIYTNEQ